MRRFALLGLLVLLSISLFTAVLWAGNLDLVGPPTQDRPADTPAGSIPLPAGRWECWDDGSLDPCHRYQVAIQALADDDVWVGSYGRYAAGIRHFDGDEWVDTPPERPGVGQSDLQDLAMLSDTFGLAVGNGDSWRWDGHIWQAVPVDHGWTFMNLNSIDIAAEDDAWAAGHGILVGTEYGALAHWDGSGWSAYTVTTPINSVSMAGDTGAWAVAEGGIAYYWDGGSWVKNDWPGGKDLYGVAALPGGKAWAVGISGSMAYYDGSAWMTETLTTGAFLNDIIMTSPVQGYAVGSGGMVLEYDGQDWTEIPVPKDSNLYAVDLSPTGRVFALGHEGDLYSKLNNDPWEILFEVPLRDWLYDVAMLNKNDGWVIGNGGRMQRWNGSNWSEINPPFNYTLHGLDFLDAGDGWAVGNSGATVHWNGSNWHSVTPITITVLNDVSLISPTLGFAVGHNGAILKYDGAVWSEFPSPTTLSLYSIEMVAPDDGWAAGGGYLGGYVDVILRWDGQDWDYAVPQDSFHCIFTGISALNPDVYFSCAFGLYHFNGSSWHKEPNTQGGPPTSVAMFSEVEGWVPSTVGAFSHWDGRRWKVVFNEVPNINAVQYLSHDEAWAVTGVNSGGAILHYTAPAQVSAGIYPGSVLSQTYPGHETAISPTGSDWSGNNFIITYKLRPRDQGAYLGLDHFFELGASKTPFTATLTITIDNPEAYGVLVPFVGLYRLEGNSWTENDIALLSNSYDLLAPAVRSVQSVMLEYEITEAGSYGVLMAEPESQLYLPAVQK